MLENWEIKGKILPDQENTAIVHDISGFDRIEDALEGCKLFLAELLTFKTEFYRFYKDTDGVELTSGNLRNYAARLDIFFEKHKWLSQVAGILSAKTGHYNWDIEEVWYAPENIYFFWKERCYWEIMGGNEGSDSAPLNPRIWAKLLATFLDLFKVQIFYLRELLTAELHWDKTSPEIDNLQTIVSSTKSSSDEIIL